MNTDSSIDDSPIPPLPVICDACRATGMAGDEVFAAIPDILDFEPVPRRAHANGWTPEHQRAFIAALAITGSPRQAARYVGRAQYGAEQLRTAKGGRAFAAAWDSAMDLARDRELSRLHGNLGELARKTEEANAEAKAAGRLVPPGEDDDGEEDELRNRAEEARSSIFAKLQKMRFRSLREEIVPDPAKRAAWITLYGAAEVEAVENGTWEAVTWEEVRARDAERESCDTADSSCGTEIGEAAASASQEPEEECGPRVRRL